MDPLQIIGCFAISTAIVGAVIYGGLLLWRFHEAEAMIESLTSRMHGKAERAAQSELQTAVAFLESSIMTKLHAQAAFVTKSAFTDFAINFTGIGTQVKNLEERADVFNSFITDLGYRVEAVEKAAGK